MLLLSPPPSIMLVATGSVTLANSRISAVANTAFVDFSAANVLTDYVTGHHYLILYDSTMKTISGYIKAAGTGETYGSEILTNGTFDTDTTGWGALSATLASIAGGQSNNCLEITRTDGTTQQAYQILTDTTNRLNVFTGYVKSGSSGNEIYNMGVLEGATGRFASGTSSGSWVQGTKYYTTTVTNPQIRLRKESATAGTMLFDEVSLKQVLTPSATGVTIVSTIGGTTQSWTSQTSGFAYNDASGFTYKIYRVRR
jgi:hypothetical protein